MLALKKLMSLNDNEKNHFNNFQMTTKYSSNVTKEYNFFCLRKLCMKFDFSHGVIPILGDISSFQIVCSIQSLELVIFCVGVRMSYKLLH